jgi:Fe2+ transport system protein FeoA
MGLAPGVAVRVMGAGSPMTLAVGESRLALGRALADALLVAPR